MQNIFSDEMRRNPYPAYDQLRSLSPLLQVPPPFDAFMLFDYDTVKWALNDHQTFSSCVPAPPNWFIFLDPPAHAKQRALVASAFTPRMIANLEPRIRELSREHLTQVIESGEMDLAADFSVPLPVKVIAEMIGVSLADWQLIKSWTDAILQLSYTRSGGEEAAQAHAVFTAVTIEMNAYVGDMIKQRRTMPAEDLLTRLITAEVNGERLTQEEILGFFQLLLLAGTETTTNLLNNAIICFTENPEQLALLKATPELLPSAIEEVLRYQSPIQWMMRTPRKDVQVHGQTIPAGKLVLPMIGSANRDPKQFTNPAQFDITRDPNPHIAFGHGIHSCLGAALSRMEARIALADILNHLQNFELAENKPWEPRKALHVHGPVRLPIRFKPSQRSTIE